MAPCSSRVTEASEEATQLLIKQSFQRRIFESVKLASPGDLLELQSQYRELKALGGGQQQVAIT